MLSNACRAIKIELNSNYTHTNSDCDKNKHVSVTKRMQLLFCLSEKVPRINFFYHFSKCEKPV